MNTDEINDIARRLTQQWTSLIKSRMQTPSNAQERAFMKQLEANGSIVFQYENQELLVRLALLHTRSNSNAFSGQSNGSDTFAAPL